MTPKEKAIELVSKFYRFAKDDICNQINRGIGTYIDSNAKQCALIHVQELLIVLPVQNESYDFYIEVKSELEKL